LLDSLDVVVQATDPTVEWRDSNGDDYEAYVDSSNFYLTNKTDGVVFFRAQDGNIITLRGYKFRAAALVEDLAAADDNKPLGPSVGSAITVTDVFCKCHGTCTTNATVGFEDDSGNAMTLSGTLTCSDAPALGTATVTSGGGLTEGESVRFDVTNTPDPTSDDYEIGYRYTVTGLDG
jgi:hypothetical protein